MFTGLPKSIYYLFFANTLMTLGNLVYPFFTLYLTEKVKMQEDTVGFIILLTTIVSFFGLILGGVLLDKYSRKNVLIVSLVVSSICCICATIFINIYIIISFLSIGFANIAVANLASTTIIGDITNSENRKSAFAFIFLGINIGYTLSPIIGSLLFTWNVNYLFWMEAGSSLLAGTIIYYFLDEGEYYVQSEVSYNKEIGIKKESILTNLKLNPYLLIFCLIYIVHPFIYSQITFSFPLLLNKLFIEDGVIYYGILTAVNGISVIILTPIIAKFTNKVNSLTCMAIGGCLYAIGFGSYYIFHNIIWIFISIVIWSIGEILIVINSKLFIADNTDPSNRARFNLILNLVFDISYGLGPGIMGKVIILHGMFSVWLIIFFISILFCILILLLARNFQQMKTDCLKSTTLEYDVN